ncbi:MAG: FHA domain-containing protein, partial [Chloroflexi bacterium]
SRPHARLQCTENHWVIYDLGSSNGTFVNDNPVSEKGRPLRDGDIIQMGTTLIVFRAKEAQASDSTNGDTVS